MKVQDMGHPKLKTKNTKKCKLKLEFMLALPAVSAYHTILTQILKTKINFSLETNGSRFGETSSPEQFLKNRKPYPLFLIPLIAKRYTGDKVGFRGKNIEFPCKTKECMKCKMQDARWREETSDSAPFLAIKNINVNKVYSFK